MWPKKVVTEAPHETPVARTSDNERFIHFLYRIFFDRDAEPAAVNHWMPYLEQGMTQIELFHVLWNSAEFAAKASQNKYLRAAKSYEAAAAAESTIITDEFFKEIVELVDRDRLRLLEIGQVRGAVAQWRYRDLMQTRGVTQVQTADLSIPDTIAYSEFTLRSYVDDDRPNHMVRPLLSIGRVAENISQLKVLSIGPRTETEFFALLAGGFARENITMIDLFSYSPFIKVGDMHAMEFDTGEFDIVVFGDVLAYSKTPAIAVKEIIRVAKHKAIVSTAHGRTKGYVPLFDGNEPADNSTGETFGLSVQSTEDILNCFRPHVGHVYFRCEAENPKTPKLNRVLTIFEIVKQ